MYHSPKESRPLCKNRYGLAQRYFKDMILSLDRQRIIYAGYGSYAVIEALDDEGALLLPRPLQSVPGTEETPDTRDQRLCD